MPTTILRFSKAGVEDLNIGVGTFDVQLSNGVVRTLHKINLSSFVSPSPIDNAIYYTTDDLVGQSANLTYDPDTMQLTVGGLMRVGSVGVAAETLHVAVDGPATARIENTGGSTSDAALQFALHGVVDWNITADDSDADNLKISVGTSAAISPHMTFFRDTGAIAFGSSLQSSFVDSGIIVHANTGYSLVFRANSVDHGMTSHCDTNISAFFGTAGPAGGGAGMTGLSENEAALWLRGFATTPDATTTQGSLAPINLQSSLKSGTDVTTFGGTANLCMIRNNSLAKVLFKGDGDICNAGGSTAMTNYDDYDDVQLLQTVKAAMAPNYRQTLGEFVNGHTELLEQTGVITRSGDGWFISQRGWRGLIVDAFGQLDRRLAALEAHAG